jgi:hypothetical protein
MNLKTNTMTKIMSDKKISGIHNYCDRWCERCSFGSRCAVYEHESLVPGDEKDKSNKAFWDRLAVNFAKARGLMEQAAKKHGVDLNVISNDVNEIEAKSKRHREQSREHPIGRLSWEYSEASVAWLKSQPGMLVKLEELKDGLNMGIESVNAAKTTMAVIKDCVEVVQWYMTFINVKLVRALTEKMDYDGWEEENGLQCDFDGSAKIAIIGIERSLQAWIKLFEILPDQEDHFLKVLAMLEKLKDMVIKEFPNAMDFKRPGFDDQPTT